MYLGKRNRPLFTQGDITKFNDTKETANTHMMEICLLLDGEGICFGAHDSFSSQSHLYNSIKRYILLFQDARKEEIEHDDNGFVTSSPRVIPDICMFELSKSFVLAEPKLNVVPPLILIFVI